MIVVVLNWASLVPHVARARPPTKATLPSGLLGGTAAKPTGPYLCR